MSNIKNILLNSLTERNIVLILLGIIILYYVFRYNLNFILNKY